MKRREFTSLLGGAAVWPLEATAQRQTMQMIGYLGSATPEEDAFRVDAFRRGLNSGGYVEGQNVAIEYRWAEGQDGRFPALAADLVRRNVDLIAAMGAGNAARSSNGSQWSAAMCRRDTCRSMRAHQPSLRSIPPPGNSPAPNVPGEGGSCRRSSLARRGCRYGERS